jgi:hypothetical protein
VPRRKFTGCKKKVGATGRLLLPPVKHADETGWRNGGLNG